MTFDKEYYRSKDGSYYCKHCAVNLLNSMECVKAGITDTSLYCVNCDVPLFTYWNKDDIEYYLSILSLKGGYRETCLIPGFYYGELEIMRDFDNVLMLLEHKLTSKQRKECLGLIDQWRKEFQKKK